MFAQNYLQVTRERGERQRRYDDIEERVQGAAARGAAPSRTHFGKHRARFVDRYGRVYVLPIRGDRRARSLVDTGEVGDFFDPEYTGDDVDTLEDDGENAQRIGQQLPTLRGSVFMYVWRPKNTPHVHQRTGEPIPAMPPVSGSAGDTGEDFVLRECDDKFCPLDGGVEYTGRVRSVEAKRRAQRGQVVLDSVFRIN